MAHSARPGTFLRLEWARPVRRRSSFAAAMSFGSAAGLSGMTTTADTSTAARRLRRSFRGPVHQPGDARYDEQRATWSGALLAAHAIVAEAMPPADVREAVAVAREHGLRFAVQASGH